MNNKKYYLTAAGAEKLQTELEDLKGPKRLDLARRLRIAIQQGDLSENADYIATKEEQGFLEGRIQEIEHILRNLEIIPENTGTREMVEIGAYVTIQEDGFEPERYHLVGPNEANPREGRISHESPIGRAMMGKKENETAVAKTPNGEFEFKILKIE
jgi:transcription elongation factor GreA